MKKYCLLYLLIECFPVFAQDKDTVHLDKMLVYVNRIGVTVAKNSWGSGKETTVEKNLNASGLLKDKADLIKMDVMVAENADENRIIEGIRKLVE